MRIQVSAFKAGVISQVPQIIFRNCSFQRVKCYVNGLQGIKRWSMYLYISISGWFKSNKIYDPCLKTYFLYGKTRLACLKPLKNNEILKSKSIPQDKLSVLAFKCSPVQNKREIPLDWIIQIYFHKNKNKSEGFFWHPKNLVAIELAERWS